MRATKIQSDCDGTAGPAVAGMRRARQIFVAVAAAGLLVSFASYLLSCSNNQPKIDDLQFQKSGVILAAKTVAAGQSYGWGDNDLASVPDTPLVANAPPSGGSFNLWYQTPVTSTEVDLFALDPASLADSMTNSIPFVELATGNDQFWALQVQNQEFNPPAAAIPFPGPGIALNQPFPPLTMALSTSIFLAPNLQPLLGEASNPNGTGSVKAARIYDHGSCSVFQPAFPVYKQIQTQFDSLYACTIVQKGGIPRRTYSHLATQLRSHPNDPTNFSDGFVFDAYYGAGIPAHTALTISLNQSYTFYVSDGLIGVQAGKTFLSTSGGLHDEAFGVIDGILHYGAPDDNSVPLQLDDFIEKSQTRDVFNGNPVFGCKADGLTTLPISTSLHHAYMSDCQDAINALGLEIGIAAPKFQLSPQDVQSLKNALGAQWPYTDGKGFYRSNWRCIPRTVPPGQTPPNPFNSCQFTVPVKRINVYPDGVEAVLFDGKEVNNAAYALFIAAWGANPNWNPQKMCTFTQVQPGPALSYKRPFANYFEESADGLGDFGVSCP